MKFIQLFRVTGIANSIVYDPGVKSTETEKKRLTRLAIQSNAQAATDDNDVQGWHERAKVFEVPEKIIPTQISNSTTMVLPAPTYFELPIELDLPTGESFKVAIKCAATATNIRGFYEYEIIEK